MIDRRRVDIKNHLRKTGNHCGHSDESLKSHLKNTGTADINLTEPWERSEDRGEETDDCRILA
jgi:hypothetical protein